MHLLSAAICSMLRQAARKQRYVGRKVMTKVKWLRPALAPALVLGLSLGWSAAQADSTKVEFPVSSDPSELPQVWPEQAGVDSGELVKLSQWIRDLKLDIRSLVVVK